MLSLRSSASYVSELARLDLPLGPGSAAGIEFGSRDQYDLSLELSMPIFTGMRTKYIVRSAEEYRLQAIYRRERSRNTILLQVHRLYYGLQANLLGQEVLRASTRRLENHLNQTRNLLEHAQATAFDTLEVANRLLETETALAALRHQYRVNAGNLAHILDIPAVDSIDSLPAEDAPPGIASLEEYERAALAHRPEIAVEDHALLELDYKRKAARAAYFPQVYASARYHYARPGVNFFENEWMDYYSAAVQFQWELWNMGRRGNELKQADRARDVSRLERERVRKEILREVAAAYEDITSATDQILLQGRLVGQERERYRIVLERYREGLATSFDLRDAEESLTSAELRLAGSRVDFEIGRAALNYSAGLIGLKRQPAGEAPDLPAAAPGNRIERIDRDGGSK